VSTDPKFSPAVENIQVDASKIIDAAVFKGALAQIQESGILT